jgi:homoserine kinase type II
MERAGLDRDQVRSILSLYHLEALDEFGSLEGGDHHASYWVRVGGRKYVLRVIERTRVDDLVFEKELLLHLGRYDLPVPRLLRNVARGTFTPWAARGRFVSIFEHSGGRSVGVFEVRPRHAKVIGRFAAHLHLATSSFKKRRHGGMGLLGLEERLRRLEAGLERRRLPQRLAPTIARLRLELDRQSTLDRMGLPSGTVHGSLTLKNTRWRSEGLVGVIGFETSASERFSWEIAVAINDWCWQPSSRQRGGPAGRYSIPRIRALLAGYGAVRPLDPEEWLLLGDELKLSAITQAIANLCECELQRINEGARYHDHRHALARLDALEDGALAQLYARSTEGGRSWSRSRAKISSRSVGR